jgi:hypothetical protein
MPLVKARRATDGFLDVNDPIRFTNSVIINSGYPLGKTYYVRNNGTDSTDEAWGLSATTPFDTGAYAVSKMSAWDRLIWLPSTDCSAHHEVGVITIPATKYGLKIIGLLSSSHQWGSPNIHHALTASLVNSLAHQVEICNIGLHHEGAGTSVTIAPDSGNTHVWRNHIHDCYFGGNGTALVAIAVGGTGTDAPCSIIEDCHIQNYTTTLIVANCGYGSIVRNCFLVIETAGIGIEYVPNSTSRPFGFITGNKFTTSDASGGYGIKVTNTPTAGYLFIDDNSFNNFADAAHAMTKHDGYLGKNYVNGALMTT